VAELGTVTFSAILLQCRTRAEMIVTFMALLELIKLGQVAVVQAEAFGEITLQARAPEGSESNATVESAGGR
jgi:segregation and condensation protein A